MNHKLQTLLESAYRQVHESSASRPSKEVLDAKIDELVDNGPRMWMRVSNDWYTFADGGEQEMAEEYYPGWTAEDFKYVLDAVEAKLG
jgi:hypothetical protein